MPQQGFTAGLSPQLQLCTLQLPAVDPPAAQSHQESLTIVSLLPITGGLPLPRGSPPPKGEGPKVLRDRPGCSSCSQPRRLLGHLACRGAHGLRERAIKAG